MKKLFILIFLPFTHVSYGQVTAELGFVQTSFQRYKVGKQFHTLSEAGFEVGADIKENQIRINSSLFNLIKGKYKVFVTDQQNVIHAICVGNTIQIGRNQYKVRGKYLVDQAGNRVSETYKVFHKKTCVLGISYEPGTPNLALGWFVYQQLRRVHRENSYANSWYFDFYSYGSPSCNP